MTAHNLYDAIYKDDIQQGPHCWIQWKATDVCCEVICDCGSVGHVEGDFFYAYQCNCGKKYAVSQTVKLIPLEGELLDLCEKQDRFIYFSGSDE